MCVKPNNEPAANAPTTFLSSGNVGNTIDAP